MCPCENYEVIAVKKKIVALALGAMMSMSVAAMAATPDAEMMSAQQVKANTWIDAMLVKNKPTESLKVMSPDFQKNVDDKKITEFHQDLVKHLGKLKGASFVSWVRIPGTDQDQMLYLMSFEKEKLVRCVFFFDKKGNLHNFALTPEQQPKEKEDKKK